MWSLYQWGKSAIALLGTGTPYQYELLKNIKCNGYVLCLDPDEAGRHGTLKIGNYLQKYKKTIYVADMPVGKDVNDLTKEEFSLVTILTFNEWKIKYKLS